MDRVDSVGFAEGRAVVRFADGSVLRVEPEEDTGPVRIKACEFVVPTGLGAVATETSFWSEGPGQQEVAVALGAAIEAERKIYKAYRSGQIEETVWQEQFRSFWKVMIRCRAIQTRLAAGTMQAVGERQGGGGEEV